MYRVALFRCIYGVSPLLIKIEGCGFRGTVSVFHETKDTIDGFVIAFLISDLQGDFENLSVWSTPRISVTMNAIEEVKTDLYRFFYVEFSGVISFFSKKIFFEL